MHLQFLISVSELNIMADVGLLCCVSDCDDIICCFSTCDDIFCCVSDCDNIFLLFL